MPLFMLVIGILVLFVMSFVYVAKKEKTKWLSCNIIDITFFILSLIALIITVVLFRNLGLYVSDHGGSALLVTGGSFWLSMYWFRLLLLFVICLISGVRLIKNHY